MASIPILDLSKVDQLDLTMNEEGEFGNFEDVKSLAKLVDNVYEGAQGYLRTLSNIWEENINFYLGNHYIYYNEKDGRFEGLPTNQLTKHIPRPITNFILPIVQTVVSVFTQQKPNATVRPNSTDKADENAAKLAERLQDYKWEADDEARLHVTAAMIMCLTGTCIRKDYWDPTKGPVIGTGEVDEEGNEETITLGDTAVEILDPFRVIPDWQAVNPIDAAWFMEVNIKPIAWAKDAFGKTGEGFTGLAEEMKEDHHLSTVMQVYTRLKTTAGPGHNYVNYTGGYAYDSLKNHTVVKEVYIRPTKKYPAGLLVVVSGGQTLYVNSSPYYNPEFDDSWHPYSFCKYQEEAFRFHGISLVENLVSLNKRINQIDALMILNRMTMAMPQWLWPSGHGIPEGSATGKPGQIFKWNPNGTNGAKPEKIQSADIAQSVLIERQNLTAEMFKIARVSEILQGIRPKGAQTATEIQTLHQETYSSFSPTIQNWEKFIEQGQAKKLMNMAKFMREPRTDMIRRMQVLNKDNLDVEIVDFIGSDLRDNVSVRIESGSSTPRSKAFEMQNIKELAQSGLFGPVDPMQNPIGNKQMLEKFGVKGISTPVNADVERANWVVSELQAINRGKLPPEHYPTILPFDNLEIHLGILENHIKKPNFKDEQGMFARRYQELMGILQQQQQAAMEQQMQQQQMMAEQGIVASPPPAGPNPQGAATGGEAPGLAA